MLTKLWESIKPLNLLAMPSWASLEVLGEAAGHFASEGQPPDGLLLLAPEHSFSPEQLRAARAVGGRIVAGYAAPYSGVEVRGGHPVQPGATNLTNWSGYRDKGVCYALDRDVLLAVLMAARNEELWRHRPPKAIRKIIAEELRGNSSAIIPRGGRIHFSPIRFAFRNNCQWRLESCATWRNTLLYFHPLTGEKYTRIEL